MDSSAEVRAHGRVIPYRRLGSGPPLVLLGAPGAAERLASRYRVIVPEAPGPGEDVIAWLTAFLEGLGTSGATVIAAERYYRAARELARLDPDRLTRVLPVDG